MTQTPNYESEKLSLIAELQEAGIKHTPEKIVRIAKRLDGRIIFLEEGNPGKKGSGLAHILEKHKAEFAGRGISEDQIADAVMTTVISGEFICYQRQKEPRREIYKVSFNDQTHYIAVDIGDNGYIVGANPSSP